MFVVVDPSQLLKVRAFVSTSPVLISAVVLRLLPNPITNLVFEPVLLLDPICTRPLESMRSLSYEVPPVDV